MELQTTEKIELSGKKKSFANRLPHCLKLARVKSWQNIRKIAENELATMGDVSTLADPNVVENL